MFLTVILLLAFIAVKEQITLQAQRQAYEESQKALRIRDEFISIASHELKTPITALSLQMRVLEKLLIDPNLAEKKAILKNCQNQFRRLNYLIEDLLDITRIQKGNFRLNLEQFDLKEMVDDVVGKINDNIELHTESCMGTWDSLRMSQVVVNLLSNAVKYGNGKLITVSLTCNAEHFCELKVQDRGVGIPHGFHKKIFEKFERAGLSASLGGLGLGLYITRTVVEAHGGTISAQTVDDTTVFTVRLPRNAQPKEYQIVW